MKTQNSSLVTFAQEIYEIALLSGQLDRAAGIKSVMLKNGGSI